MKKVAMTMFAVALSLGAAAEEELVRLGEDIAMPKSTNAKVGLEGLPCVAIQVPHSGGGYVSISCGASHKVANEDAITKLQEASGSLGDKLARFRVGNATFYGFYCKDCGGYEGHAVAMGGFMALYVFPPKGRPLDAEALEILKKVVFLPQKGFGIDSAIRLYGPKSPMKASAKFPVLKKMVEARPESVELIDLLRDVAREAGETATAAWCEAELKRLDPEVYGTPTTSVPMTDFTCEQGNKIVDSLGIYRKFAKKAITIPTGASATTAAKTKTVILPGGAKMEFVWCEKGTFTMGQNDGEWAPAKDEEPRRKITLTKGFWIAKYETTQGQWKSVMGANPSHFTGDDELPVEMVSWKSCREFAEKAGAALGAKMRLPTEAEWEYACRAGTRTTYHWGGQPSTAKANYDGTDSSQPEKSLPTVGKTVKVGSYEPNAWGLCDMAGNVAEWCEDDWQERPSAESATDPLHRDGTRDLKVYRGGAWRGQNFTCRSAERSWFSSANERDWLGVRFLLEETAGKPDAQERVPPVSAASGDVATTPSQGRAGAPRPPQTSATTAAKTKTVTLPGGATMEMIWCPPGTYMMGRRADSPCKDSHDVCPPIKVTLTKGFWLGKYEVTQAQWKSVMGTNPSDKESFGDDLPVNNLSWDDAVAFVKNVGNGARLPTDAEWEYACKAGTDTVFHWGDTCNGTEANCNGTKPFGTEKKGPNIGHAVKVGSYRPNAWGFHDMAGNVAEWCNDRHADYYLVHPEELTDPKGGDSTVRYRTVRGGCFYTYWQAIACRSVKRDMLPPDWPKAYVGFRMGMDE